MTKAIVDSQRDLTPVKYQDGSIIIESLPNQQISVLPDADIEKRIAARLEYQEGKRQSNIENITQYAVGQLAQEKEIDSERPDSDWVSRFFRIAEDVTTEQMQMLWSKVLAGEVQRLGSFSLRTLELLKNISQKEAE